MQHCVIVECAPVMRPHFGGFWSPLSVNIIPQVHSICGQTKPDAVIRVMFEDDLPKISLGGSILFFGAVLLKLQPTSTLIIGKKPKEVKRQSIKRSREQLSDVSEPRLAEQ
jgi:hypothetical protein